MVVLALALLLAGAAPPWPTSAGSTALEDRFAPPPGFVRLPVDDGSFGAYLRRLPVKAGRPPVQLFDGRLKGNQAAHAAVLDVDVGPRDLQQCADFVIRMFAEYQRASGASPCFRFTSGDRVPWARWREGERPVVVGRGVAWRRGVAPGDGYPSFRAYLDEVFSYAGTRSLARDLRRVPDPARPEPGDVFVRGGSPGHAVLVLDVAEDASGARVFLLGQSFMPAQEPHVLVGPLEGVWYPATKAGPLATPEWRFERSDLLRFGAGGGCPG